LRTAHAHHEEVSRILKSLRYQYEALHIASGSLDLHVLDIEETFEAVTSDAKRELEKQESLLSGLNADLEIVQRVTIHREFVSPTTRKAMDLGDRGRTLGDYVHSAKMLQVAETCGRTHRKQTCFYSSELIPKNIPKRS
jgi:autophagy-related protein 11